MAKNKRRPSTSAIASKADKPVPSRLRGIVDSEGDDDHPIWRLTLLDQDHHEGWSWRIDEVTLQKIISFLTEMERLTWREVWDQQTGGQRRRGAKHKFIPVEHLCAPAQRRLEELGIVEWDQLFRFRTGWKERLWGAMSEGSPRVFYPIWWDPHHQICPTRDRD